MRNIVYHQAEGRYICGDAIHATRDYMRLSAITYQSFGLDKNKALREEVLYFLAFMSKKELVET